MEDPFGSFGPTVASPSPVFATSLGEDPEIDSEGSLASDSASLSSAQVGKRDGVIYVPKADRESERFVEEKQPLEARWGKPKANKGNLTQGQGEDEDGNGDVWKRGYQPQEPPGNDIGGDMEIFYLPHIDITTLDELLDELTYVGEVDTAVDFGAMRAWLPIHKEQPGISKRAPAVPKVE